MPPTNNFLPFCPTDTGSNLLSESDYTAAADRVSGNKPGVASAKLNNKAIRQANAIASQVAQFLADQTGTDLLDDGVSAKLLAQINGAMRPFSPINRSYLTAGAGTHNATYLFMIASGSATAAATYTNNGITYTVVETVASGVVLKATGSGAPTVSGTLTKASGTGDATLTFYAVRAPLYLKVRLAGAGAGGGGSTGSGSAGTSGSGGTTSFGASLLTATGGVGVANAAGTVSNGGAGGTATVNSPAVEVSKIAGGSGQGNAVFATGSFHPGGMGGSTAFGGAGGGSTASVGAGPGLSAAANSGAGGGGSGGNSSGSLTVGPGGGAGAFIEALIPSPSSTYAYVVGAKGAGGTAGTGSGSAAGGDGADGRIEVTEYYQ